MLNNKFLSVFRSSCMCRIPTQTYCKILLSICVAMCMCIPCNIYVALGARGLSQNHKTVLCTTMVTETIQYYTENDCKNVFLLLLDASKVFDKVMFHMLFNELIKKNVSTKIIKLLLYMYTNQDCDVQWDGAHSSMFKIFNGVKQGSVISPLLFALYIDGLFLLLKQLGRGCHVGLTYAGALGYADDIALVAPSLIV